MTDHISSFRLGIDLDRGSGTDHKEAVATNRPAGGSVPGSVAPASCLPAGGDGRLDHFIRKEDRIYAGTHLIVDLWEAARLDERDYVEQAVRQAALVARATLLHVSMHHFSPNFGVSGVAVLAESHISVHTWPEIGYAAFDIFMCGDARPELAAEYLCSAFMARRSDVRTLIRGELAL